MYKITFANGARPVEYATYEACLDHIRVECGDPADPNSPVIGHDGDLPGGGDRTLFWSNATEARNDDGARALGTIRKA